MHVLGVADSVFTHQSVRAMVLLRLSSPLPRARAHRPTVTVGSVAVCLLAGSGYVACITEGATQGPLAKDKFVHIAYAGSRAGSAAVSLLQLPVPEAACCALSGLHITSKLVLPLRLRYPFVHSMVWSHLVLCSIAPHLGMGSARFVFLAWD